MSCCDHNHSVRNVITIIQSGMCLSGKAYPLKAVLLGMNPRVGGALLWPGGSNQANASMARELDSLMSSLAFKNSCNWAAERCALAWSRWLCTAAISCAEYGRGCESGATQARPGAASRAGELLGPHRQLRAWSSRRGAGPSEAWKLRPGRPSWP